MGSSSGNEQVLENVRLASDSGEGSGMEGLLSRLKASVALARADVFFEILNKIAKIMKLFVKVDLLHSYAAPY